MFASLQGWKRVVCITPYIKILLLIGLWTEWITETALKGSAHFPKLFDLLLGTALEQGVDSEIVRRLFLFVPKLSPRCPHPYQQLSPYRMPPLFTGYPQLRFTLFGRIATLITQSQTKRDGKVA